jgi:hypothetical protein
MIPTKTTVSLKILLAKCIIQLQFNSKVMLTAMQKLVILDNITNKTGGSFTSNVFRRPTNEEAP